MRSIPFWIFSYKREEVVVIFVSDLISPALLRFTARHSRTYKRNLGGLLCLSSIL